MYAIIELANNLINIEKIFLRLLNVLYNNTDFKEFIVELNTENQLFEQGINSVGVKLEDIGGGYSGFTISYKISKGQPYDRVTLRDTGDFYRSFFVQVQNDEFIINANTTIHGDDLTKRYGDDIIGLTDENLQKVSENIADKILSELLEAILPNL